MMRSSSFSQVLKKMLPIELWNKGKEYPFNLERVWEYEEAKEVCEILSKNHWYILGGDVYEDIGPYVETNGDSWSGRELVTDVEISASEYNQTTKDYLDFYYQRNGNNYWYAFVFCDYEQLMYYANNPAEPN